MIESQIEIAMDDDHRWLVQSKAADGTVTRRTYGSRMSLMEAMPHVLARVRGIKFPSIDIPGDADETITIGVPQRRKTD